MKGCRRECVRASGCPLCGRGGGGGFGGFAGSMGQLFPVPLSVRDRPNAKPLRLNAVISYDLSLTQPRLAPRL